MVGETQIAESTDYLRIASRPLLFLPLSWEAFEQLAVLIAMSVLLDAISQFLILREVFRGAALIVGPVLIALPYSLTRAVTNRIVRRIVRQIT